jgi:hypothetical protein
LPAGLQWHTCGQSGPRPSLHREADRDSANARRKALLRRVVAFLRRDRRPDELLSFERVRRELGTAGQAYLGMQRVPVSKIVGSVGRHGDFDGAFLSSKWHLRERWQRINRMWRRAGVAARTPAQDRRRLPRLGRPPPRLGGPLPRRANGISCRVVEFHPKFPLHHYL